MFLESPEECAHLAALAPRSYKAAVGSTSAAISLARATIQSPVTKDRISLLCGGSGEYMQ